MHLINPNFLDNMPAAYIVMQPIYDIDGEAADIHIIYANNAFARLCGIERQVLCDAYFNKTFKTDGVVWARLCAEAACTSYPLHFSKYSEILGKMLSISAYCVQNGICACMVRDVTEQRQISAQRSAASAALRRAAETDALTGLYNSGAGRHLAKSIIETSKTANILFVFDMDNFKQINDSGGHANGDNALCAFADVLARTFRTDDIVWRHGGDEFAALIPGSSSKRLARCKCVQIQKQLQHLQRPLSCSIGVACGTADFAALFNVADAALYKTKADGKAGYTISRV